MNKSSGLKQWSIALSCALMLTACGNEAATSTTTNGAGATGTATASAAGTASSGVRTASLDLTGGVEYEADDAYSDWRSGSSTTVKLSGSSAAISGEGASVKNGTITISAAGAYVVSGKLDEGQIVVDVPDKGTVRLVLNGAEIHNGGTSPIYVKEAGKTIVSLEDGTENVVSDGESYTNIAEDEPNSAIYSKDDLTINGTGKLVVDGHYNNGITSKDKLKITGGTIEVDAVDDGIMGRDLVAVRQGDITVKAGGHAVKTTNDAEDSPGIIAVDGGTWKLDSGEDALHSSGGIRIAGGQLDIKAGDDAIHADVALAIQDGTIHIASSYEGLEAPTIVIDGGVTVLASSDDGVNAASGSGESSEESAPRGPESGSSSSNKLTINGGYLYVDAQGDGLDANGSIEMNGGTVIVSGPTENNNAALDYDGTFVVTGGTLVAAGSSGMAQAAADQSTQAGILMTYPQAQQAGTLVNLTDGDGKSIVTFAPAKAYQAVFITTPDMKKDGSYTLYSGGTAAGNEVNGLYDGGYTGGTKVVSFDASSIVTWVNESGVTEARSGMGGPGGGMGGRGGGGGFRGQGGIGGDRMPPEGNGAPPEGGGDRMPPVEGQPPQAAQ